MPVGAAECVRTHWIQPSTRTDPDDEILLLPSTDFEASRHDGLDGIHHRQLRQVEVANDDVQVMAVASWRTFTERAAGDDGLRNDVQTLLLELGGSLAQAAILSLAVIGALNRVDRCEMQQRTVGVKASDGKVKLVMIMFM
jgi:hypothetical protein